MTDQDPRGNLMPWLTLRPGLISWMHRRYPDEDAENVIGDVYLRAVQSNPPVLNKNWFFTVARRLVIDRVRRRCGQSETAREDPSPHDRADESINFDNEVAGRENVDELLAGLSGPQREALEYRFVQDMAIADIASATNSTDDAVKKRIHRGLRTCHRRIERQRDAT